MLVDNRVFVTGAASGIGLATVEALLAAGASVVAADCNAAELARLGERHAGLHMEVLDVADEAAVAAAMERSVERLGPPTGVVNVAGIGRGVTALETSAAFFRRVLDVNLIGSFLVAREAARHMAGRGGSIVNISSVSGIQGNFGRAAYGASKSGIDGLTRVLAAEWAGEGIRVNAVAPGPIETPMAREAHSPSARKEWTDIVPMARYGTPEEVAGAILFLLDEAASSYVTGQTLCVDGGFVVAGLKTRIGLDA